MTMNRRDDFTDQINQALNAEADSLDYRTQIALQRARTEALQEARQSRPARTFGLALATTALSGFLAFTLWWPHANNVNDAPSDSASLFADLEILASDAPVELYAEMEFYLWLEESGEDDAAA